MDVSFTAVSSISTMFHRYSLCSIIFWEFYCKTISLICKTEKGKSIKSIISWENMNNDSALGLNDEALNITRNKKKKKRKHKIKSRSTSIKFPQQWQNRLHIYPVTPSTNEVILFINFQFIVVCKGVIFPLNVDAWQSNKQNVFVISWDFPSKIQDQKYIYSTHNRPPSVW